MVGGGARQFRSGDFDAGYFQAGTDEDVVDAHARKAAGIGAFGLVVLRLGLNVFGSASEPAAYQR